MGTDSSKGRRAALVTGASSGIGLEVARALGEAGYGITISARRPEKLAAAEDELRGSGLDVLAVPAQVGDEVDIAALLGAHRERFGRLDVLVNNAGVGIAQPAHELETKFIDMQLAVNLRSAMIATRESLGMLREAGAEHGKALVVNMASISGKDGWRGLSVYSATKAGMIAMSESVQKEVAADGIQVTALCPGLVDTAMAEGQPGSEEPMIEPADIAASVLFLLGTSPRCLVPEMVLMPPASVGGPR